MKKGVIAGIAVVLLSSGLQGCGNNSDGPPTHNLEPGKYVILESRNAEVRLVGEEGVYFTDAGTMQGGGAIRFEACGIALTDKIGSTGIRVVLQDNKRDCMMQQVADYTLISGD